MTMELAIKECMADIAAKNTETYNGGTFSLKDGTEITIPNAKLESRKITIYHVAVARDIQSCFAQYSCNGKLYKPYWVPSKYKIYWMDSEFHTLNEADEKNFTSSEVMICLIDDSGGASQDTRIFELT